MSSCGTVGPLCERCRNITFRPVPDSDAADDGGHEFTAEIHPNLASLEQAAADRCCRFCVLLHGLVRHKKWGHGVQQQQQHDQPAITLELGYPEDDMTSLDLSGEEEDFPSSVIVSHPLGRSALRILNAGVLSASLWDEDPVGASTQPAVFADLARERLPEDDHSTGSDSSMNLAARWINECRNHHAGCRRSPALQKVKVPTRLVDVSDAVNMDGAVKIITSSKAGLLSAGQDTRYATLSHRWTPGNPHTLTTQNEPALTTRGIRVRDLSRTFAEACVATRRLGLRHLWIDSLCILQDDGGDKAREIPLMGDYYGNAELNIAASTESIGGLWRDRERLATAPMEIGVGLEIPGGRGTRRFTLQLAPGLELTRSHLDSRGWILQERLFPVRTLFFDSYWISFDCAEMIASESCPEGVRKGSLDEGARRDISRRFWPASDRDYTLSVAGGAVRRLGEAAVGHGAAGLDSDENKQEMYSLWYRVVKDFNRRMLTFESDRLPAISALAEQMSGIVNDTYVAGLWRRHVIQGLEWYIYQANPPWQGIVRSTECRAPTCSWASLEMRPHVLDPVDSRGLPMGPSALIVWDAATSEDYEPVLTVLDVSWRLADDGVPFGPVLDAALKVRGRLIRARVFSRYRSAWSDALSAEEVLEDVSPESILTQEAYDREPRGPEQPPRKVMGDWDYWQVTASGADASGRRGRVVSVGYFPDDGPPSEGFVFLLPLRTATRSGVGRELFCLVLERVSYGNTYRRIGAAKFPVSSWLKAQEGILTIV